MDLDLYDDIEESIGRENIELYQFGDKYCILIGKYAFILTEVIDEED